MFQTKKEFLLIIIIIISYTTNIPNRTRLRTSWERSENDYILGKFEDICRSCSVRDSVRDTQLIYANELKLRLN